MHIILLCDVLDLIINHLKMHYLNKKIFISLSMALKLL
jgi:hypothetical protein